MTDAKQIAVLAGDGIGPEVMVQALAVLDVIQAKFNLSFVYHHGDIGGAAFPLIQTLQPIESHVE